MDTQDGKGKRTFTEEIEVMGNQLVDQVKDLLKQGNVRQLRIKASDGDIVLETPLTFGVRRIRKEQVFYVRPTWSSC